MRFSNRGGPESAVLSGQHSLRWLTGAALLAVTLLGPSAAHAGGMAPDLDAQLRQNPAGNDLIRVTVQFSRPGADGKRVAATAGDSVVADLNLIHGAALSIPRNALRGLQNNPNVAWVSPDRNIRSQWDNHVQSIRAYPAVWADTNICGENTLEEESVLIGGEDDSY